MNINPISRLIRFGILAFDILVAAGLLLSAYGGAIDPNKSVWPQIFGMTFPAWIILMLVMVPVSFIIQYHPFISGGRYHNRSVPAVFQ